jgi:hypothetical protein
MKDYSANFPPIINSPIKIKTRRNIILIEPFVSPSAIQTLEKMVAVIQKTNPRHKRILILFPEYRLA